MILAKTLGMKSLLHFTLTLDLEVKVVSITKETDQGIDIKKATNPGEEVLEETKDTTDPGTDMMNTTDPGEKVPVEIKDLISMSKEDLKKRETDMMMNTEAVNEAAQVTVTDLEADQQLQMQTL